MTDPLANLRKEVQDILRHVTLKEEQGFLGALPAHKDATLEQDKIISDFYLAKLAEKVSRDLIASNERLSASSSRQAIAITILTAGLFIVGAIEIAPTVIRWFSR